MEPTRERPGLHAPSSYGWLRDAGLTKSIEPASFWSWQFRPATTWNG